MPPTTPEQQPTTTLPYRSGLDEPVTEWREGFDLIELVLENLFGVACALGGLALASTGVYVVVTTALSTRRNADPVAATARLLVFSTAAGFLFFLARQFIGVRPRR
jgi:hypothetical protein